MRVVQTGVRGSQVLQDCVNLTGATSFRGAAAVVKLARLLIVSEGGMAHAANAVGTPAVVVVTGFTHPTMTAYPEHTNVWIGKDHGPCGKKVVCSDCENEAQSHDPE